MGLREEKKREQRRRILDAAVALFRERGYDETRVQDIVDRVRVCEATFFNYFPAKDALLEEYAVSAVEGYADMLRAEMRDEDRTVPDRVRELVRTIGTGIATEDRDFMAIVATRSKLFNGGEGNMFEQKVLAQGILAELLREGQERGEITPNIEAEALAEGLTGAYTATIVNWLTRKWEHPGALEERMDAVVDVFLDGCRGRRATRRRARGGRKVRHGT